MFVIFIAHIGHFNANFKRMEYDTERFYLKF